MLDLDREAMLAELARKWRSRGPVGAISFERLRNGKLRIRGCSVEMTAEEVSRFAKMLFAAEKKSL